MYEYKCTEGETGYRFYIMAHTFREAIERFIRRMYDDNYWLLGKPARIRVERVNDGERMDFEVKAGENDFTYDINIIHSQES